MTCLTMSLREVAAAIGISADWLYRHLGRLEQEHAFPPPVPGLIRRRWNRAAIEAWLNRAPGPEPPVVPLADDDELARWAAELDRRAAAL
jgi:predicted DNA-binding transcriptional regulator AlpA